MGLVAEKMFVDGLFGGVNTPKSGKIFLNVVSRGPKIDKIQVDKLAPVSGDVVFGSPVRVHLFNAEQKFQDYNGSFSVCQAAEVVLNGSPVRK